MPSAGGLYVNGNTTAVLAAAVAAKYTQGWTAFGTQRGDLTITEGATAGTLTCKPGKYMVHACLSVETEDISGTSGDDVGIVHFSVYKDSSAVTGLKSSVHCLDSDRPQNVVICGPVEVDAADTGALSLYVSTTDASGNDICVTQAQFTAWPID